MNYTPHNEQTTNTKPCSPGPSVHSRAARRATSPSINTDKSLKAVRAPPESLNQRPAVLGLYQNAGVSKKSKRGRKAVMSTRARTRHERALERAEEIGDRTALKVAKSKVSAARIDTRRKTWDEINASAGALKDARAKNMFGALDDGEDDEEDVEEVDNFDDEMEEVQEAAPAEGATDAASAALAPPPQDDDDEEIL